MQRDDAPILEFDPSPTAVIEPTEHIDPTDIPHHAVLCFFQDVIAKAVDEFDGREIDEVRSEIGLVPVYELNVEGSRLALVHPGVGAPLAAAFLEELIARGVTRVVACGGAGVLVPEIALGHVIVPTAAIRDEGTSYHYLAPSREVQPSPEAVAAIVATLERHGIPHVTGKTWTTDALYRETREKAARRVPRAASRSRWRPRRSSRLPGSAASPSGSCSTRETTFRATCGTPAGGIDHETGRQQLFRLAAEAVLRL